MTKFLRLEPGWPKLLQCLGNTRKGERCKTMVLCQSAGQRMCRRCRSHIERDDVSTTFSKVYKVVMGNGKSTEDY